MKNKNNINRIQALKINACIFIEKKNHGQTFCFSWKIQLLRKGN